MGIIKKVSFSKALFTQAQQHVLGLLYSHPDRDFYTNEIIRLAKSGTGAVQRELLKLSTAGLIVVKQVGNQKRYQANRDMPFFAELRSIVLKTFGLADIIKHVLNPLERMISFAFIYGSVAKQEDTAKSDIDLMIITDQLTYAELFPLLEKTEAQLGRIINPTFYSQSEWIRKYHQSNNFITQLIEQPKIFLIGSENELAKLR